MLVNRVAHDDEARDSFARLELAVGRFLGHPITWLGAVHEHAALGRAVRRPGALLAEAPPGLAIATQTLATRLGLTAPVGESR